MKRLKVFIGMIAMCFAILTLAQPANPEGHTERPIPPRGYTDSKIKRVTGTENRDHKKHQEGSLRPTSKKNKSNEASTKKNKSDEASTK
jgi:hypothetical protein